MSEMSMLMHGMGLEAFVDERPDVNYERVDVDDSELIEAGKQTDFMIGELAEQQQRVAGLIDARDYALANRESLSEEMASELRSRVIAVLGEDRGVRLVGSVESYNGPNGLQILDCGLESIGGMIRSALAALIKLIRTGARILMNFFASAKVVLGNQLRAIGALSAASNRKIEGWDEFMVNVGNSQSAKPNTYTTPPSMSSSSAATDTTPLKSQPVNNAVPGDLSISTYTTLAMESGGYLFIPSDFTYALRNTCDTVEGICLDVVGGFNKQYGALLNLFADSIKFKDGIEAFNALQQMSADKFLPMKRLGYDADASTATHSVLTTGVLLGDTRFTVESRREALYATNAQGPDNRLNNAEGLSNIRVYFTAPTTKTWPRGERVKTLSRTAALQSLALIDKLVKAVIDSPLQAEANALSKEADKIASTVIPRLDSTDDRMEQFQSYSVSIMSGMTNLTAAGPRLLITYVNNLASAVREFVELSGDFK